MKHFVAAIICVALLVTTFAGCGYSDALSKEKDKTSSSESAQATKDEVKVNSKDYKNDFNGLCSYFLKLDYITDNDSDIVKMDASLIGAKQGNKYTTSYDGKQIKIELYELDNNDKSKEIVNSIKKDGTFTILDLKPVTAYLSDNGKYLMVYSDDSIDKEKPDKNSKTYIHREEVIDNFKSFYK